MLSVSSEKGFIGATTAWMLKYTGELFPVPQNRRVHVYGSTSSSTGEEVLQENTYAATFLYKYDRSLEALKAIQVSLLRMLYKAKVKIPVSKEDFYKVINGATVHWSMLEYEEGSVDPYSLWQQLDITSDKELKSYYDDTINYTGEEVKVQLNQHFTRVRYGITPSNLLKTIPESSDIVFRISSVGINWLNQIYSTLVYLREHYSLSTVSIVRDLESTGSEAAYKTTEGISIWLMPIDDFLSENQGKAVLESLEGHYSPRNWAHLFEEQGGTYLSDVGSLQVAIATSLSQGFVPYNMPPLVTKLVKNMIRSENRAPRLE